MTVKYNDPYGKREYAQLKGDKSDSFFKVIFDEATLHKAEDSYILYGNITEYQGVVRSFKPENAIEPGICAVPFYGQEYEIRSKDKDGQYQSVKVQPSVFESALYKHFLTNENVYIGDNLSISGEITHLPNAMCQGMNETSLTPLIVSNCKLVTIPSTGKIPTFEVPSNNYKNKGYGGYKSVSPDEKIAFIIKQLTDDVKHVDWKSEKTLAQLTEQIIFEHQDEGDFISVYFDMIMACVR